MSRTPPNATTAAEASNITRWAGTWNDITSMIAAENASVASMAFNIGPAVNAARGGLVLVTSLRC